jgi:hypothetical protein
MSIEQNLIELTAAISRLTTVMVTAAEGNAPLTAASTATVDKSTRTKKAAAIVDVVAQVTTQAQEVVVPVVEVHVNRNLNPGDEPGTRYFHIADHNTVYKQGPNDPDCKIAGAKIVSGAEYLLQKAEIEKKFPTAAAQAVKVAAPETVTTAPSATAPAATASDGPTFAEVVEKVRELHKAQGNAGVAQVLTKYGVAKVPELNGKASNAALMADIESVLIGL